MSRLIAELPEDLYQTYQQFGLEETETLEVEEGGCN